MKTEEQVRERLEEVKKTAELIVDEEIKKKLEQIAEALNWVLE